MVSERDLRTTSIQVHLSVCDTPLSGNRHQESQVARTSRRAQVGILVQMTTNPE